MDKRQAVSEMMRHVEAGHAYTIEDSRTGEPLAIVIPWESYAGLKAALQEEGEARER